MSDNSSLTLLSSFSLSLSLSLPFSSFFFSLPPRLNAMLQSAESNGFLESPCANKAAAAAWGVGFEVEVTVVIAVVVAV